MELFVYAILLAVAGAQESQMKGPENTLRVVGSTATLKCSSPSRNCSGIDWMKYVPGASSITVFKGPRTVLDGVDKDRYSVDNSSGCDLVIRNVQLKDAGRFICSAIISSSQMTRTAHLIILKTQPKCSTVTPWNDTVAGDEVQLNCAVTYNGTNNASVVWKGVDDAPAAVENGKTISRSFDVVASVPVVPSFTCITSFLADADDQGIPIMGLATNIPTAICATSAIKVLSAQPFKVEGPQNTLSVAGSTAALKCSSPSRNCIGIDWMKYGAGSPTVFRDGQGILSPYGDRYSINSSSSCDLVIKDVQLADAGRFICSTRILSRIIERTSYFIVLEALPKCTTLTYWHELSVGDEVNLNCLVTYNEANTASMIWKRVEGTPVDVVKGKTISRSDWIVASAPEVPSFTCITSFPVETRDKNETLLRGLARNIPNTTCSTSRIRVLSAQQLRVEEPQNTLGIVGSTVTLKCSSAVKNCDRIEWLKYSAGSSTPLFNYPAGISIAYGFRYSVDNSSCYELLTIKSVQLTDAGRFICSTFVSTMIIEKTAYLIVLESQPKCSVYASLDDTTEGDGVQLNCEMTMNGINTTAIVWNGVDDAPGAVNNRQSLIWSYYVVASAPEVPSFTCIIYPLAVATKDADGRKIKGLAANMPTTTCETSAIKVLHSVRDVQLSPSSYNYPPGSRILCVAKGYPLPALKWQEMENGSTWMDIQNQNNCEFTVTNVSSKRYRCVAMNVVRGKSYSAMSHEFLVNNTESDDNDSLTVTTTSAPPSTVVASVAAGVAFICLLFILPINCFLVQSCPGYSWWHSRKNSKDNIREEYQLSENPDLYSCADQLEDAHATVKPRLVAPTGEPPSRPQLALPPRTTNPKTELSSP